jgi:hypothetical protein
VVLNTIKQNQTIKVIITIYTFYKTHINFTVLIFAGLGSAFTYMVALNTNIINMDKRFRGTIVGLLNAFFAGSPSVFVQIYLHVLTGEDK